MRDPFGIAFYPEYRGRDGSRTPMPWAADAPQAGFTTGTPWLPIDRRHFGLSVDRQERDAGSALFSWRQFLAWRRSHPALIEGELNLLAAPEPLIAFRRSTAEESLLVVLNLSDKEVTVPGPLVTGTHPLSGHGFTNQHQEGGVVLPRYGMFFAAEELRQRKV
jgi:alpha-glucosidase